MIVVVVHVLVVELVLVDVCVVVVDMVVVVNVLDVVVTDVVVEVGSAKMTLICAEMSALSAQSWSFNLCPFWGMPSGFVTHSSGLEERRMRPSSVILQRVFAGGAVSQYHNCS